MQAEIWSSMLKLYMLKQYRSALKEEFYEDYQDPTSLQEIEHLFNNSRTRRTVLSMLLRNDVMNKSGAEWTKRSDEEKYWLKEQPIDVSTFPFTYKYLTLALKWKCVGAEKPSGVELKNPKFAEILQTKLEFSKDELFSFGVNQSLTYEHYVFVGDKYFQPVQLASTLSLQKHEQKKLPKGRLPG